MSEPPTPHHAEKTTAPHRHMRPYPPTGYAWYVVSLLGNLTSGRA